ncbi:hypothetical protein MTF65_17695 [Streptomyces sp. APSN-46.1]|uniref:hypothetical protein n=1 Tax=Streptomyces sp. APSN-46.1 TaxID=2929049 RepID=UPI001FB25ABC|nr:hypothetical protein [Streptomyces sp. APSN-46.1]MCJ1679139.1 hypothetical protein [Streptomyces sp. APSN-46.1]
MDPVVLAVATALVSAMATDAWQQARSSTVALWQRAHPEHVPAIEDELTDVRDEVLEARRTHDVAAEERLTGGWQLKFQRLVRDDPALARELQRLLEQELAPLLPPPDSPPHSGAVQQTANASGRAGVIQAGGSITINEAARAQDRRRNGWWRGTGSAS